MSGFGTGNQTWYTGKEGNINRSRKPFKGQKITCARCGFHHYKYETNNRWIKKNSSGRWICWWCWDDSD